MICIYMYIHIYIYMYMYIYIYAQRPHQDLPFMNTSDLNNIQPSSLNYIPLHPSDHIYIYICIEFMYIDPDGVLLLRVNEVPCPCHEWSLCKLTSSSFY